jgi:pyruvate, water dikinase
MKHDQPYVVPFASLGLEHAATVGGKNASLGEMVRSLKHAGVRVPDGFATTAKVYREFLEANDLKGRIGEQLDLQRRDPDRLAEAGNAIREAIGNAEFPPALVESIIEAYRDLGRRANKEKLRVAVRSSATAEDLPQASFAGQLESFLNIEGEKALLDACRRCFASLFTDRAISYREKNGFEHIKVALSVGVQEMVNAAGAGAGVMFSIDTETGFPRTVLINAAWGLGESVVGGMVQPDEYLVFKPLLDQEGLVPVISKTVGPKQRRVVYAKGDSGGTMIVETSDEERTRFVLSDEEILTLARWAVLIEEHYGKPMDMEWAKDEDTGDLFIVQARPETVQSQRRKSSLRSYRLTGTGKRLVSGLAIGEAIAAGTVCRLESPNDMGRFPDRAILVAETTDPDWGPVMKRASAIITDHGGRTSHAAIVSRELAVPAVVGTENATSVLTDGQQVTVSCAEGDQGFVYEGVLEYEEKEIDPEQVPKTKTEIMLNMAEPAAALRWWRLPSDGVGLARIEFIINNEIKIHPLALLGWNRLEDEGVKEQIEALTTGYEDKAEYFVDFLAYGIGRIAASQHPHRVIVRLSDFKTNEYANLIGGKAFEPEEHNPMLGWRGASRYYSDEYRDGFALECRALCKVRDGMGLTNVAVMIPFCRSLDEADCVLESLAQFGLVRGRNGLEVYVMAELPANVILAADFARRFDGFSIGSNDLTQLVLGVDRDSDRLSYLFDESDPAVTLCIRQLIEAAHGQQRKVGLCGQAPSTDPSYARFLVEAGIDSISVTPDSFLAVKGHVAAAETEIAEGRAKHA